MAIFTLTTGPDTVVGGPTGNTVYATAATLNAGDRLTGGAGIDVLDLIGSGTFSVDQLAGFTGFESIKVDNPTNSFASLTLGSQPIEVDVSGYLVIQVGSPSNWNSSDVINGDTSAFTTLYFTNFNGLPPSSPLTYDLTSNTFSHVSVINGLGDNLTLAINNSDTAGVQNFSGLGLNDKLATASSTLDLSHTTVSGFTVASTNGLGTTFTVGDLGTAFQIAGGPGQDTIETNAFTFTADQRNAIFATASIEKIIDPSGVYAAPSPSPSIVGLTTGNDTIVASSSGLTVYATAATLNAGDSLTGGAGIDVLDLIGSGTFSVDQLAGFSGFESIKVDNPTNSFASLTLGSQPIEVDVTGDLGIQVGSPSNWNSSDVINGDPSSFTTLYFENLNGLPTSSPLTYDLTSNTFSHVSVINGLGDNLTLAINNSDTAGVQNFSGLGLNDKLATASSTLDLSHTTVSGFTVASTNGLGTTFTVGDLGTAFQIAGGPGQDTIETNAFTFTADQRNAIFATASIEKIIDPSGVYAAPSPSPSIVGLTTGNDTIVASSSGLTVYATAATLNAGDSLTGGAGIDVLDLIGSGTFSVDQLAGFSGFESIKVDNPTNSFASLTLGSQPIEVDVTGDLGIQVGSPSNWNSSDVINGDPSSFTTLYFENLNGLPTSSPLTYDLTSNTFSHVSVINGLGDNLTLAINNSDTAGVQNFSGLGLNDKLATASSTLDLSHTTVSGFTVASTNGLGTTFTVGDLGTAFQIAGGPGQDTLIAKGFTLTSEQRAEIFATNSIETITDQSGTYSAPPSSAMVAASGVSVSGAEGSSTGPTTVATFTDANPNATASDFTATINWGDGTTATTGTIVAQSGGGFAVDGGHTYADEGQYTIGVTVNDVGGSTASTSSTASVADAALSASGTTVSGTEGTAISGATVASFTDANPNATASDFTATINWGDGTTATTGTIVAQSGGGFAVDGGHTYADEGQYTIGVTVNDVGGSTASASSTANVAVTPTVAVSIDNTDVNVADDTGTVTFAFSQAPVDFALTDVTAPDGTLSNLSGSGTSYTATFTANAGIDDPNATVSVTAGSYHDADGNAGTGGSTAPFPVDTVTPTVAVSINNTDVNVADDTGTVTFAFSQAPVDFALTDVTAPDGTLSNLSGSGTTYTATFTANAGVDDSNATVSVTSGSYQDADGNAGTGGSAAAFTVDTVTPTVAVSISNTDVNVADDTGTVTFTFSQAPMDFALTDVTAPDGTLSNLSGSGTSYTATFTANAGIDDPNATVSVTAGSYHDADGNAGSGGSTAPFTVDTVTVTVTAAQAIANYQSNPSIGPQVVVDSAANVAANLDGLETLSSVNNIVSISLTDSGTPTLNITETQLANDALALEKIVAPFTITPTGTIDAAAAVSIPLTLAAKLTSGLIVADTAENVAASLDGLETLASANDIVGIILPYRSTLAITLAQLANDGLALALMTPHAITIADTAENVTANLGEVIQLVDSNKIFSIAVTDGAITLAGLAVGPVFVTTRVIDAFLGGGTTVFLGNGGSTYRPNAIIDNTGDTINLGASAFQNFYLNGGAIDGGVLITGPGGFINSPGGPDVIYANVLLDVTLLGGLTLEPGNSLELSGGTISGVVTVGSSSYLFLTGDHTLENLTLNGGNLETGLVAGTVTITPNGSVQGYGDIGGVAYVFNDVMTLKNEGIINSNTKSQLLDIQTPLINDGLVEATNGGKMEVAGAGGDGQFLIGQAATLELGGLTAQAVTFESGGGGGGTLYLDNATDFSGTVTGLGQADSIDLADFAFSSHPVITNVTGTGAAGSTTDVTIADGPLTTTLQILNQYAGEYPTASTAYYLKSDNAGSSPGTLFATVVNPALTVLVSVRTAEGVTTGTAATFTDANQNATASDFSATINWGDGTNTTGTVVAQNGGGFAVDGAHTYADEGKYTVDVVINDVSGITASATSTATVADALLTATGVNITSTEGSSTGTTTVATFTDANPNALASDFTATIYWGDGTTTTGTIVAQSGGGFAVDGAHTYADEGAYAIGVTINDVGGSAASATSNANIADAALTASGTTVSGTEGAAISGATIATFTDANPNATASDFTATIDWGDGTTTTGTVIAQSGGGFAVDGGHTYADEGKYAVGVSITDVGGSTASATSNANIADAALTASATTVSGTEGTAIRGATVATFTDANPNATASDFTATINWGDGTSTTGTVVAQTTGGFAVDGTQTYADEGNYTFGVTINDVGGSTTSATSTANIVDAALTASGTTVSGTEGTAISEATIATFTDANPNTTANDFTASINWGDGTSTSGTVVAQNGGGFAVDGGHTYADEGKYTVAVTIDDVGGSTTSATTSATIADAALTGSGTTVSGTEGAPVSGATVATFTDANTNATPSDFTATIDWGDGTSTTGTIVAESGGGFAVDGTHTYANEGKYAVSTTIKDAGGGAASVTTSATVVSTVTLSTLVTFNGANGAEPFGSLIADAHGDLFGTTVYGGVNITPNAPRGDGTVFEIAKTATGYASTPTTLVSFNGANGATPLTLIADAHGDLFGTTTTGGPYGYEDLANFDGTVFEIAKTADGYASTPTTLVSFNGANGRNPQGSLIADAHGDLFGTTAAGGEYGYGTMFEIAKTAQGYASTPTTLVSFNIIDGNDPLALISDTQGDLFGTTNTGGAYGFGTVFEIAKTADGYASTPTTLVSFNNANGAQPTSLIADAHGDLFGTTSFGGNFTTNEPFGAGTVFEIAKTADGYASTPTTLVSFNGTDGAQPFGDQIAGSLIADAYGNLFGTTSLGGTGDDGTVFEIAKTAHGYATTPTTLVNFNSTEGGLPFSGLIADAHGDLFGTTVINGENPDGTVFEITNSGFVAPAINGTTVTAIEGATTRTIPVATFTDANPNATASDFTATIDWGDGTSTSGTVVAQSGGDFAVDGEHIYTDEGRYTVTTTIKDVGGSTASATSNANIADAALTASGTAVSGTEGAAISGATIATFTDANPNATASDFTATIDWGDGTTTTGTVVVQNDGGFAVDGAHTYADEGKYAVSTTINDVGASTTSATSNANIADAALTASGTTVSGTEGTAISGATVATFTDGNPNTTASDFTTTIDWGDGTSTADTVVAQSGGGFAVAGGHTYADEGQFKIGVTIDDVGGSKTSATSNATIADAPLTATGLGITGTEDVTTGTVTVATFTDANPNATASDFTAAIDWGDGTSTAGTVVAQSGGGFAVEGSHSYANDGKYNLAINIDDTGGSSASATSTADVSGPLELTINPVDGNNVINHAEAHAVGGISITGKEAGLSSGATLVVSVADGSFSKDYTATVKANGSWKAMIPSADAVTLPNGAATITAQADSVKVSEKVTVDETFPTVLSIVASPSKGDLDAGKVATLTVDFSAKVTVTGSPVLKLNDGGLAHYVSGSGTSALKFAYQVAAGQNTGDLTVTGLALAGGATIRDAAGNNAVLSGAVRNPVGILEVDTRAPTIKSVNTSGSGVTNGKGDLDAGKVVVLTVAFSERVTVTGKPTLKLNDGGVASYLSGSGTTALKFAYTVAAGQNTADLKVMGLALAGGATIRDAAGNNAVLAGAITNPAGVLQIDTKAPTIKSVITSGSGITNGKGDLDAGKTVVLTVDFSEKVTVSGHPVLKLNDGGLARYVSGSGSTALKFTYTVAAGQNTADLTVTGIALAGGATIKDGAGNNAVLAGAVTNPLGILQIDTTAPQVNHVVTSPASGEVVTGQEVRITLDMTEKVTVAGSPTLFLNDEGTATYDAAHSTASALAFDYTVAAGQATTDLAVSGIELPTAGSIRDLAGNTARLSGAGVNLGLEVNNKSLAITGSTDLQLLGPSNAHVAFGAGSRGTLTLDDSQAYTGTVAGLAPGNHIDLADISFGAHTTLGYTANDSNSGGALTASDHTHVAKIALLGQYAAASFVMASDGHGGTLVTDPPELVAQAQLTKPHA